ncbi:GIY-YIG nuclease family protein, partial [Escherichia coli]|uniref:GIY-YIG nuclease family protein n=1 Tax=Escherichia coli TaxID=562 RepID=UPI0039886762
MRKKMKSAMEFPHQVYLLRHAAGLYVGITSSLQRRLEQHKQSKSNVELLS